VNGFHFRRLLAKAAMAASRVAAQPCVGLRPSWCPKASVHTSKASRPAPHWPYRCDRRLRRSQARSAITMTALRHTASRPRVRPRRRRSPKVGGGSEPSNLCEFQSQTPYRRWLAKCASMDRSERAMPSSPRRARPQSSAGSLPSARLARRTIGVRHGLESNRR
jgi:hypothetical protein